MSASADRLDPQISSDLTLVLAVVGQRSVGDSQIKNTGVLIADQFQPGMAHDFAVCNINSRSLSCYINARSQATIDRWKLADWLTFFASWLKSVVIHEHS